MDQRADATSAAITELWTALLSALQGDEMIGREGIYALLQMAKMNLEKDRTNCVRSVGVVLNIAKRLDLDLGSKRAGCLDNNLAAPELGDVDRRQRGQLEVAGTRRRKANRAQRAPWLA